MIGEHVADWVLTGILGHGSQGIVYEAQHVREAREAAVKVLAPRLSRDAARVERFFDEARAAASIQHRGIVQVHEHGLDEHGRAYIVMERVRGDTLFDRLRSGPMPVSEAVGVLRQLAAAMGAAHGHVDAEGRPSPVVHRDLKPEHVMLAPGETEARVVLVDFGIAKLATALRGAGTLTGAGAFGTPPYMSPEQCRGDAVDHRTDLYALGCLLYEMLSGTPPFGFGGGPEMIEAHCTLQPPRLTELAEGAPPALDALAAQLLAKNAADRPASAAAVLEALDAAGLQGHVAQPARGPAATLVDPRAAASGALERAWRRVLDLPPWSAAGVACVIGSVMLGASIVLGVGDGFLSAPNWAFSYVVLVPIAVLMMLGSLQQWTSALRSLASRGLLRGDGCDATAEVARATRRTGAWLSGLAFVLAPVSVVLSVAELIGRRPKPGLWWSDSPPMGVIAAIAQGLLMALIILFVVQLGAWAQLLRSWTVEGAKARLRAGPAVPAEPRRGFEVLEEPLSLGLGAGVLAQLILYLSNAQYLAEARHTPVLAVVAPLWVSPGARLLGAGDYQSSITVVSSAMVAGFLIASLLTVRRALTAAGGGAEVAWPARSWRAAEGVTVVVACVLVTAVVPLGPPAVLGLAAIALVRSLRGRVAPATTALR